MDELAGFRSRSSRRRGTYSKLDLRVDQGEKSVGLGLDLAIALDELSRLNLGGFFSSNLIEHKDEGFLGLLVGELDLPSLGFEGLNGTALDHLANLDVVSVDLADAVQGLSQQVKQADLHGGLVGSREDRTSAGLFTESRGID